MSDTPADNPAPAEWKPEPREWTWQDIFKAPMIALKLRCMIISVATIFAMVFIDKGFGLIPYDTFNTPILGPVIETLNCLVMAVAFGIGGTFVAIFIKSELLDDDYPTLAEAVGQFKQRLFPAIMVPVFLVLALKAIYLGAYVWALICSIPFAGSVLYFASIPSFLIMFLYTLFGIGVFLSFFVFPSIVAIRKHGWFDNVIDTLEAVGTKPHKVIASIVVTCALIAVCMWVGFSGFIGAKSLSHSAQLPGTEVAKTEAAANYILSNTIHPIIPIAVELVTQKSIISAGAQQVDSIWHQWITGLAAGIFQTVIIYLISGYAFNVLITGGMLSYLHVREDDYWDDEDLADLDKLAKELEEEAANAQGDDNKPVAADGADDSKEVESKTEEPAAEDQAEGTSSDDSSDEQDDTSTDEVEAVEEEAESEAESNDSDEENSEDKKD
ncbi:MAG: hypothetical protein HRU15_07910 [Planctomycetes bacterium]|nr:hypothetical protein [Planctomycetota bacterium]